MRESKVEKRLVDLARREGWYCRKIRYVGRNGAPDRVLIKPNGEIIFVELKAPGKKPGPLQRREHTALRDYGQVVRVVDTLEGVEALFG